MSATIAIVGRPNVGKSTLFNRLTSSRNALVGNTPGLTRDRQYGIIKINEQNVILVDTGGIGEANSPIESLMEQQANKAIEEADVILFLFDARSGLTNADEILANSLRKLNKPIVLAINKSENQDEDTALTEFYHLGLGTPLAISAEHNEGISLLLATLEEKLPKQSEPEAEQDIPEDAIKIAFVGRPNVGKSTLVNRILGEERVISFDKPGTTRDSIFINFNRRGKDYVLVDTAGIRRRGRVDKAIEGLSVIKALQAIEKTNVVVFVVDAQENITDQDLRLLGFVLDAGKALVIAVNKWDDLEEAQRTKIQSELDRRLTFISFAKILFISALHGTGIGDLFGAINKAYTSATKELKTTQLSKILERAIANHQPPLATHGQEVKLRYAHTGGHNPPCIIIHGSRVDSIPDSYRRYLERFYREALDLSGTPIRIMFKSK